MASKKGKFIVIYGANNLGKTTQVKLLSQRLEKLGKRTKVFKYPIYDLEPTGPILNRYLRQGLKISELEAQKYYAQNRRDFEPTLRKLLFGGYWVIAEDYKGTGICWGVTHGVKLQTVLDVNKNLFEEDLAILLDGEQFKDSIEKGHHNEDTGIWDKGRKIHLKIGKLFEWKKVNANQSREEVASDIWKEMKKKFSI